MLLQASWEVRAQLAIVSSAGIALYTTHSQFSLCQKSPGWDVVPDLFARPTDAGLCFPPRSTLPWEEVLVAVCRSVAANPTTAQEHNMLRAKAWRKSYCFGPAYVLEGTIPKQICFASEIQLYLSLLF